MEKIKKAPSGQANTPNTANVPKANNQVFAAVSNFCSFLVGPGIIAAILVSFVVWQFGPNSRYHFDNMLEEIVTAKYNPHIPDGWAYITRDQDAELKEKLRKNIGSERDFFLLRGESGSGKTTMTQHLLKEDFEDGVIFVNINAESLEDVPKNKIRGVVQDAVLDKFPGCKNHPCLESFSFSGFIEHANDVRQTWLKSKGKKPRTLILYITLDTEDTVLKYKNMDDIAAAIGGMASHLSSISNKCKTILEFSETRISDTIRDLRGDLKSFKVKAMTEKEFLDIGKQLINVTDPEGLIEPYLKYYHDWLGGHTKALAQFAEEAQIDSMYRFLLPFCTMIMNHYLIAVESATADTKDEVLKGLKEGILLGWLVCQL